MFSLENTSTARLRATVSIDGQMEIPTAEHLLKERKRERESGRNQESKKVPTSTKEIMLMTINTALESFIGQLVVITRASIKMT